MSQALQDDTSAPNTTTTPTTAEYEDQGEAFSRAIARELRQVLALVELAEREQDRGAALGAQKILVLVFLILSTFMVFSSSTPEAKMWTAASLPFLIAAVIFGQMWFTLSFRQHKRQKAAAEVAETIREVVSASNWQAKLDPLDWAHLRTRVANLELIDLSSLK